MFENKEKIMWTDLIKAEGTSSWGQTQVPYFTITVPAEGSKKYAVARLNSNFVREMLKVESLRLDSVKRPRFDFYYSEANQALLFRLDDKGRYAYSYNKKAALCTISMSSILSEFNIKRLPAGRSRMKIEEVEINGEIFYVVYFQSLVQM